MSKGDSFTEADQIVKRATQTPPLKPFKPVQRAKHLRKKEAEERPVPRKICVADRIKYHTGR